MRTPWDVLGVAMRCSEKELKTAYARLVKEHRPDRDPEGFQRVHSAYNWMRAHREFLERADEQVLRRMMETGQPPDAPAGGPEERSEREGESTAGNATEHAPAPDSAPQAEGAPQPEGARPADSTGETASADAPPEQERVQAHVPPPELERIVSGLVEARKNGDTAAEDALLKELTERWRAKSGGYDEHDDLLAAQLAQHAERTLPLLSKADAALDIGRGNGRIAHALCGLSAARGDWEEFYALLEEVEAAAKRTPHYGAAVVLSFCAELLALVSPARAQEALDQAYPNLPPDFRENRLRVAERLIAAGHELKSLNMKDRRSLATALARGELNQENREARVALAQLSYLPEAPIAKTLLAEAFPQFKDRLRVRRAVNAPQPVSSSSSGSGQSSGSALSGWQVVILVVVALNVLRACTNTSSPSRSRSSLPPPQPPAVVSANENVPRISELDSFKAYKAKHDGSGKTDKQLEREFIDNLFKNIERGKAPLPPLPERNPPTLRRELEMTGADPPVTERLEKP